MECEKTEELGEKLIKYEVKLVHSQSLRGKDILASLIPHLTGWSVRRSTVMLFPFTLGLSLIRFTTCPARQKCHIKHTTTKINNGGPNYTRK